jgi:hypothetical protein
MKFMCQTAGYTKWDLKRNEEMLKDLKGSQYWTAFVDTKITGKSMSTELVGQGSLGQ